MHALWYIKSLDIYMNVHMDTYMYVTSFTLLLICCLLDIADRMLVPVSDTPPRKQ